MLQYSNYNSIMDAIDHFKSRQVLIAKRLRKKEYIVLLSAFFLIMLIRCKGYDSSSSITCIDETNIKEEQYLSSVFKNSDIIRLEIIDASLIGQEINKIRKRDNRYFISYNKEVLVVFDNQGKFLFRIQNKGGGPSDYISIQDFDVLPNGNILIMDMKKLLLYSTTGEFVKAIPLDINCWNLKIIDENSYLICAGREEYSIYLIDGEGGVLSKQLEKNNLPFLRRPVTFFSSGNTILYQQDVSNDFLSFDTKSKSFINVNLLCEKDRVLDIGTVREQQKSNPIFISTDYVENSNMKIISGISSYADNLLFSIGKQSLGYKYYLMNTSSKTIDYLLTENTVDDISFTYTKLLLNRSMTSDSEDCLIAYIWPYQIIEGLDKNIKLNELPNYQRINSLFKDVQNIEDENPVLIELRR